MRSAFINSTAFDRHQSRLRECAEDLQGMLIDLKQKESHLNNARKDNDKLSEKFEESELCSNRARVEAEEWKELAER